LIRLELQPYDLLHGKQVVSGSIPLPGSTENPALTLIPLDLARNGKQAETGRKPPVQVEVEEKK